MVRVLASFSAAALALSALSGCSTSSRHHVVTNQVFIASMRTAVFAMREVDGSLIARDAVAMQMRDQWAALHLDAEGSTTASPSDGLANTMPAAANGRDVAANALTAPAATDTSVATSTSSTTTTTTTVVTTTTSSTSANTAAVPVVTPVPTPTTTPTMTPTTPTATSTTSSTDGGAIPDTTTDAWTAPGVAPPASQTATPDTDASAPASPRAWPGPGPFIFVPSIPRAPVQPPAGAPEAGAP